jgi:(E)-4-hydroxy-3-methylbut-2-enyl-diphosphate synthase
MATGKYKIFNTELLFLAVYLISRTMDSRYCDSFTQYSRRKTDEVNIGKVPVGAGNPIRLQSMTNTSTGDIKATVKQCIRMINAGADYVRITVPSVKDVEYLSGIVSELRHKGYVTPVIADIHFNPDIAKRAAAIVEKIRINPGNFAGRKKSEKSAYTENEFSRGIENIKEKFVPLLDVCKKNSTALRIGTNHGSLSERIMSRYGDTPGGMAESAMEYLRICRQENFNEVVISMKASNTQIMVQSTRLLVNKMLKEGMHFPLHIGVTEAGEGDDGRIKSAVGAGALLADGIGDTVRISLTEDPEEEIPVARKLVNYFTDRGSHKSIKPLSGYPLNPYRYDKRKTIAVNNTGGKCHPVVVADMGKEGFSFSGNKAPDYLYVNDIDNEIDIPEAKGIIMDFKKWQGYRGKKHNYFPLFSLTDYFREREKSDRMNFVKLFYDELSDHVIREIRADSTIVLVSETNNINGFAEQRALFCELINRSCNVPVIIRRV